MLTSRILVKPKLCLSVKPGLAEKHTLSSPLSTPNRPKRTRKLCIINSRSPSYDSDEMERIMARFGDYDHPANREIRAMEAEKLAAAEKAKAAVSLADAKINSFTCMPGISCSLFCIFSFDE